MYSIGRPITQHYRTFLSTDSPGGLDGSGWTKAPPLLDSTVSRERITLPPPPSFPPVPGWARANAPSEAAFLAGAALCALSPIARNQHPLGELWRQRLALINAAALARQAGRTEDEAALRDAWYLRNGNDPGPGGRILSAWRALSARAALSCENWPQILSAAFELRQDAALEEVVARAAKLAQGEGTFAAAAEIAAVSMKLRPDCEPLALWLADAVLARRLRWPAPVPLIAKEVRRADLRGAPRHLEGDGAWLTALSLACARAAAAASDLYAELARRATTLITAAPKLRSKDADRTLALLLSEDAQPATAGKASDRSSRRLFERLVALGAARELTGRPTFRLYGL